MNAKKGALFLLIALVLGSFLYFDLGKYLTLEGLKANRAILEALRGTHVFLFSAVFVLIYIVQTAYSLPGAAILFLGAGAIFGVLQGTVFGIMPGSLVFVNAGASLAAIERVSQVAGPRVLGSFALLGLFALLPTIIKAVKKRRAGTIHRFDKRIT